MASFWGGPVMGITATLRPTVANADEQEWIEAQQLNRNPMPIDPLNQNTFDASEYGLQTNDNTFQANAGMTLQEMLAQYENTDRVRQLSENPAINYDGLYQDPDRFLDYDNSRVDVTNQADYPFTGNIPTNKRARYDARAYNRNEPLPSPYGTKGGTFFKDFNPRVGQTSEVQPPDFMYASPQFQEGIDNSMYGGDRMLFGSDENQKYYTGDVIPTFGEVYESEADGITNYDFDQQPQGIVNVDQVKNLIANAQRNDFKNFYGNPDQWQGFVDRGDPLPIEPKQSLRNIIGSKLQNAKTNVGQKVGKGMDFMSGIKDYISQGGMLGMATKGIGSLLSGLGSALGFEDRQLYDDVIDEYGNVYSADELNSMNALGGYYTDPARSARRRTSRIANMLARKEANKNYSKKNLKRLQEQENIIKQQQKDKQDKIQQAATKRTHSLRDLQDSSDRGTGQNYAAARSRTSSRVSPSGRMRAYGLKDGGLASLFTRRG